MTALMELLNIAAADTKRLRMRLNGLQRLQRINREQLASRKWEYVAGPPPLPADMRAQALGMACPFPEGLIALSRNDLQDSYGPSKLWREFSLPGLDAGVALKGTARSFRVVVRNRSTKQVRGGGRGGGGGRDGT